MTTHCEKCKTWMHAHDTYALVYSYVCMSARKRAPVNLLMCPFELCMFIGVSMQLQVVFKYDFLVLIGRLPLKKITNSMEKKKDLM